MNKNLSESDIAIEQFFADEWEYKLEKNPEYATFMGIHKYDSRLSDFSEAAISEEKQHTERTLKRLQEFDFDSLSAVNKLNYEIFKLNLENELKSHDFKDYYMPITHMFGIQTDFARTINFMPFKTEIDLENYLSRLLGFPRLIDQKIDLLRKGLKEGYTVPRISIAKVPAQIAGQLPDDIENSIFYQPISKAGSNISPKLIAEIEGAIRHNLYPAFNKLKNFLEENYIPNTRESLGLNDTPNGQQHYNFKLNSYTTTDLTSEDIHQVGLDEVERIYLETTSLIKELGYNSPEEFYEYLRTNKDFYFDAEEDLLMNYRNIAKKIDKELPRFFKMLPRIPFSIDKIPDYQAPAFPTAYYMPPDPQMTRVGTYYANTYQLDTRPSYEMESLTLHEAMPGHHLQISLALELQGLPEFRKSAHFIGYIEGWGLYSEKLGEEMGFYQDPYSRFGQLSFEMWRACRLVIDTGIHALNWNRSKCIEYLKNYTGKSESASAVEVDRYVSMPGQATAYKIGELKILELRKKAEKELGEAFDIREFHNVVLNDGAVPLNILEEKITDYIKKGK